MDINIYANATVENSLMVQS